MLKLMSAKLTRQSSTSSLPSLTRSRKESLRRRLSYSLKRARGVRVGQERREPNLERFIELKQVHTDFERFLGVVQADLEEKLDKLKRFKASDNINIHDKSYASLQIFMLHKYSHIVENFKTVSVKSAVNISKKLDKDKNKVKDIDDLVNQYKAILERMKRRMKRMIDVTEKYAVVEIFDTINLLTAASDDLNTSLNTGEDENKIRSVVSLGDLVTESSNISTSSPSDVTPRKPSESSTSSDTSLGSSPVVNTFRSFTDHVSVLTKTYLNSL